LHLRAGEGDEEFLTSRTPFELAEFILCQEETEKQIPRCARNDNPWWEAGVEIEVGFRHFVRDDASQAQATS